MVHRRASCCIDKSRLLLRLLLAKHLRIWVLLLGGCAVKKLSFRTKVALISLAFIRKCLLVLGVPIVAIFLTVELVSRVELWIRLG